LRFYIKKVILTKIQNLTEIVVDNNKTKKPCN